MKVLTREDKEFPKKLKDVNPLIEKIYVEGNEKILNDFGIAVVGSRNSSLEGENITKEIVKKLSRANINIISGLARGIDSKAHIATLKSGGRTIAVIGSGFNKIYPKENEKLFGEIVKEGGAVVSEYAPDTEVNSKNFPLRNRIISGLSDGILVIEGKHRSGTTITAQHGIKQGKPIFCIPHGIYNPYGTGPNYLLKNGGVLVINVSDIFEYYEEQGIILKEHKKECKPNAILQLLKNEILTKEEIAKKLNRSIADINSELTLLELEELVKEEVRERIQSN